MRILAVCFVVVCTLLFFEVGVDPAVAPDYNLISWGTPIN